MRFLSVYAGIIGLVFRYLVQLSAGAIVCGGGINYLSPIKVAAVESHNDDLRGGNIGCNGDVVSIARQEKLFLDLVMLGIHIGGRTSITEIDKNVYLVVCDSGSDLLLSALLAGEHLFYLKTGCFRYIFSGYSGSADVVLAENTAVRNTKLSDKLFLHVMCYNSYFHLNPSIFVLVCDRINRKIKLLTFQMSKKKLIHQINPNINIISQKQFFVNNLTINFSLFLSFVHLEHLLRSNFVQNADLVLSMLLTA